MLAAEKETGSLWYSSNGLAISGPYLGTYLKSIPSFHLTWEEWLALHPDTDVVAPPDDPLRRDVRIGHGSSERIARSGVGPHMVDNTLTLPVDFRLPENTLVLGVTNGGESRVYPMEELKKEGGTVNAELGGEPIVIWVGPWPDSAAMAAFSRLARGRLLTFSYLEEVGLFQDLETGSRWNVEGKALEGALTGEQLNWVDSSFIRWHGWAFGHKKTQLYQSERLQKVARGRFAELLGRLEDASYLVQVQERVLKLQLPNEAEAGLALLINGDRFDLFVFASAEAAEDYAFAKTHALRRGAYVIESAPDERLQFLDKLSTKRKVDELIPWSTMLDEDNVAGAQFVADFGRLAQPDEEPPVRSGLAYITRALIEAGFDVRLGFTDRSEGAPRAPSSEVFPFQVPAGAVNAHSIILERDFFVLYKFEDAAAASGYGERVEKAIQAGRYVLRSVPRNRHYVSGFGERPAAEVSWSKMVEDQRLKDTFAAAAAG